MLQERYIVYVVALWYIYLKCNILGWGERNWLMGCVKGLLFAWMLHFTSSDL